MKLLSIVALAVVAACAPLVGSSTSSTDPSYPSYGYAQPSHGQPSYGQPSYGQPSYAQPAAYTTGVFVNGVELSASDKAQLDTVLGESVPAGRYTLDAQYNFGYEGQPPVVNLAAHAQQRQQRQQRGAQPMSMYSRDSSGAGSSIVDDGNGCTILSTPSGSLSSGC